MLFFFFCVILVSIFFVGEDEETWHLMRKVYKITKQHLLNKVFFKENRSNNFQLTIPIDFCHSVRVELRGNVVLKHEVIGTLSRVDVM